jgi:hypothetical protein
MPYNKPFRSSCRFRKTPGSTAFCLVWRYRQIGDTVAWSVWARLPWWRKRAPSQHDLDKQVRVINTTGFQPTDPKQAGSRTSVLARHQQHHLRLHSPVHTLQLCIPFAP